MAILMIVYIGVLCVLVGAQQHTSAPCRDLDTQACILFQGTKPNLCDDARFSQHTCKHFCGNCRQLLCYSCPNAVRDSAQCNVTAECGIGHQCGTRHLRTKDGHHEYTMTCEPNEMCNLLSGVFGKRDTRDIAAVAELTEDERGRYERDVVLNCCNTDLCNVEVTTTRTTTITTTTTTIPKSTTTTPASAGVPGCKKDIVFVLENRVRSVHLGTTTSYYHVYRSQFLSFVENVVSQINVGPDHANVAAVTFDHNAQVQWYLPTYDTHSELQAALSKLNTHDNPRVHGSGTINPGDAFQEVTRSVLTHGHGDRPDADNVVVVLEASDADNRYHGTATEAANLRRVSDNVIAITVQDGSHHHTSTVTDSHHTFNVDSVTDLTKMVDYIVNLICS